jgi:hypothetical protein
MASVAVPLMQCFQNALAYFAMAISYTSKLIMKSSLQYYNFFLSSRIDKLDY